MVEFAFDGVGITEAVGDDADAVGIGAGLGGDVLFGKFRDRGDDVVQFAGSSDSGFVDKFVVEPGHGFAKGEGDDVVDGENGLGFLLVREAPVVGEVDDGCVFGFGDVLDGVGIVPGVLEADGVGLDGKRQVLDIGDVFEQVLHLVESSLFGEEDEGMAFGGDLGDDLVDDLLDAAHDAVIFAKVHYDVHEAKS